MRALRELEHVEWRVLGALRFVDATTGVPIERGLRVDAPGATLVRNRSGLYVIRHWDALAAHEVRYPEHPTRQVWRRFHSLRTALMIVEFASVLVFIGWVLLG